MARHDCRGTRSFSLAGQHGRFFIGRTENPGNKKSIQTIGHDDQRTQYHLRAVTYCQMPHAGNRW